jgi:hypothetical protein
MPNNMMIAVDRLGQHVRRIKNACPKTLKVGELIDVAHSPASEEPWTLNTSR